MAICEDCGKDMMRTDTCSGAGEIELKGRKYSRNSTYFDDNIRCHDCNIVNKAGNLHHLGCDMERCPRCGGQLISCPCGDDEEC